MFLEKKFNFYLDLTFFLKFYFNQKILLLINSLFTLSNNKLILNFSSQNLLFFYNNFKLPFNIMIFNRKLNKFEEQNSIYANDNNEVLNKNYNNIKNFVLRKFNFINILNLNNFNNKFKL
jgi:hypothetical protein